MFFNLKSYNEDYYKIYEKRRRVHWDSIPSFRWIKKSLDLSSEDRLLDAGSGDGSFLNFLCHGTGLKGFGVDFSETAVGLARKNHPDYDFRQADITNLPFPDHSFNKIVCFNVIEHIQDQEKAMREMRRVLQPGGMVVLGTNIRDSLCWWLYQRIIGEQTHTREFNYEEFEQFVSTYFISLESTRMSGVFRPPQPLRLIFHYFLKGDVLVKAVKK